MLPQRTSNWFLKIGIVIKEMMTADGLFHSSPLRTETVVFLRRSTVIDISKDVRVEFDSKCNLDMFVDWTFLPALTFKAEVIR